MIILDTNVLSALMRDPADQKVAKWLDEQPQTSIWTTSVTIFEIQVGLLAMPAARKRAALSGAFEHLLEEMDHRIAVFDEAAARSAANLAAFRQREGRVGELRDTVIAGIVLARHATLATRNTVHFSDITAAVINPWAA